MNNRNFSFSIHFITEYALKEIKDDQSGIKDKDLESNSVSETHPEDEINVDQNNASPQLEPSSENEHVLKTTAIISEESNNPALLPSDPDLEGKFTW